MERLLVHGILGTRPALAGLAPAHPAGRLVVVEAGGLWALATAIPEPLPGVGSLDDLFASADRVTELAIAHDALLTGLAKDADVVPIRLGTLVSGVPVLAQRLLDEAPRWVAALAAVAGACEYEIVVEAVPGAAADSPEPVPLSGRDWLMARRDARDGRLVARGTRATAVAQQLAALSVHASDVIDKAPRPRAGRPTPVAIRAMLVPRAAAAAFAVAVDEARTGAAASGLSLDVRGPMPGWSFVERGGLAHAS